MSASFPALTNASRLCMPQKRYCKQGSEDCCTREGKLSSIECQQHDSTELIQALTFSASKSAPHLCSRLKSSLAGRPLQLALPPGSPASWLSRISSVWLQLRPCQPDNLQMHSWPSDDQRSLPFKLGISCDSFAPVTVPHTLRQLSAARLTAEAKDMACGLVLT